MPTNPLGSLPALGFPGAGAFDPNYKYTSGNKTLQADYANMLGQSRSNYWDTLLKTRSPIAANTSAVNAIAPYTAAHTAGHTSLGHRLTNAFDYDKRKALIITGLLALGGAAGAGAFAGGAGVGAGAGAGFGGTAATIDPFAAGLGGGTAWAPVAGGAGAAGLGAGGAGGIAGGGGIGVLPTTTSAGVGAGGFYGPAGNWTAGTAGGDFGTLASGAAATPWYNTYLGQTGINTGLNLLGGYLQNRAIGKAQSQQQKDIEKRIRQALAMLAPEHIMALAQQFLPQMGANANLAGQTAIQAVREQAARTGQLENPRALSFEAGTRAKLASDVQQRAFEAAMNNAGAQASAITGAPYTPIQPQMGFAEALLNSANQAWLARALSQGQAGQAGTPYKWPGAPQVIG